MKMIKFVSENLKKQENCNLHRPGNQSVKLSIKNAYTCLGHQIIGQVFGSQNYSS